jgi:hypothetical protein
LAASGGPGDEGLDRRAARSQAARGQHTVLVDRPDAFAETGEVCRVAIGDDVGALAGLQGAQLAARPMSWAAEPVAACRAWAGVMPCSTSSSSSRTR